MTKIEDKLYNALRMCHDYVADKPIVRVVAEEALAEYEQSKEQSTLTVRNVTVREQNDEKQPDKVEMLPSGNRNDRLDVYNSIIALTGRTFSDTSESNMEYAEVLIQNSNVILEALQQPEPEVIGIEELLADFLSNTDRKTDLKTDLALMEHLHFLSKEYPNGIKITPLDE